MNSFKSQLKKDIGTFLNVDEFSEMHTIGGKPMNCLIDDNEAVDREINYVGKGDGVYTRHLLIYVKSEDFGDLPRIDGLLEIDGKKYVVIDAVSEAGIYSITLEVYSSGSARIGR